MNAAVKVRLDTADLFYRAGKFNEAEAIYLDALEHDSRNSKALTRLGEIALLKNYPEQAEDYFKAAEQHASWLGRRWPLNLQRNTSLAMAYYRQDRFPQAARCFRESAGPIATFRDLKTMGDHLALFGDQTPYQVEMVEEIRIPFIVTDPLPVVEVSINGSPPLLFFIDTGGGEIILDTALADELGAVRVGVMAGEGGGTSGTMGVGKVDSLKIGDLLVQNVPVCLLDTQPFAAVFNDLPVKGIIGTRFLMHFLTTIDYPNARLILRPKNAPVDVQRAKVIPFWLAQTHYMVAWGTVNGSEPMLFFVDTGLAGMGFTAPEATLRDAGIAVDWSKAEKSVGAFGDSESADIVVDRLTLGSGENQVTAHNLPGVAMKKPVEILGDRLGFRIGGLVSHQFFRDYALTLDFVGMNLVLKR
jgi:predicted aspartyl protease